MRKLAWILVIIALLGAAVFLLQRPAVTAQATPPTPVPGKRVAPDGSTSLTSAIGPNSLTAQTLSNPYCYQPDPSVNQCVINLRYYNVSDNGTTAPFLSYALVSINGAVRARVGLFFENNIYLTYDMIPGGLKVPCGTPNQGGQGNSFGAVYTVNIQPYDINNSSMGFDQTNLACPAYAP